MLRLKLTIILLQSITSPGIYRAAVMVHMKVLKHTALSGKETECHFDFLQGQTKALSPAGSVGGCSWAIKVSWLIT